MKHYLRFPTKGEMDACLAQIDSQSPDIALDVIGAIEQPVALPGWHVNFIGELPADWAQYEVFPENPVRVWA